jgi:hypothetical protein
MMSAVSQNQPLKVEIKEFKTSHFLEQKTAPQDHADAGPSPDQASNHGALAFQLVSQA